MTKVWQTTAKHLPSYLMPLNFDELLQPIDDNELAIFSVPRNVTGVQPSLLYCVLGCSPIPVISLHHL